MLDLTRLRPTDAVKMLNSTSLGHATSDAIMRRHRQSAGTHIGDRTSLNLCAYIAWLAQQHDDPKPRPGIRLDGPQSYADRKAKAALRNRAMARSGQEIGPLPAVVNTRRKSKAASNFRYFCEQYFSGIFTLGWADDHLKVIDTIKIAVMFGGLFAFAMPRGSGKTTLCEVAAIWALCYGHVKFVALIGASETHATEMIDTIKNAFESNDLLFDDFPEVCHPIRALEGVANRCSGQRLNGERTHISWTAKKIVLATVPGRAASGSVVTVAGITGRIRGMKHVTHEGESIRPRLVILDDPQTDESARSSAQSQKRTEILAGAILNLAGPGKKISGIMPCTIIEPDDMAEQILDRDKHPDWQGERMCMVYEFPKNEKLWDDYRDICIRCFSEGRDLKPATAFYRKNRAAMDAGAVVAWEERYNSDEISALQHAMNLRFRDERAFFAEYQNAPLPLDDYANTTVTVEEVMNKLNNHKRGIVPIECTRLTMFIDVQGEILYYIVTAWADNFTGAVVDYGTFPDQQRLYFTIHNIRATLSKMFPKAALEGKIYGGLKALTERMLRLSWRRDTGAPLKIERCFIDANWGFSTDTVYQFCRQSEFSNILVPSHGRGIGASTKPLSEYKRKPGERLGVNWYMPLSSNKRPVRHITYDTNYWKTFVHTRLGVPMGDRGCLSIFGDKPVNHRLFAEQICAEYSVPTTARGRTVDEWKIKPDRFDNHWLDCLTGSAVAASLQGVQLEEIGEGMNARPRRRKINFPAKARRRQ